MKRPVHEPPSVRTWHALIALFASVVAVAFSTIMYARNAVEQSERQWCGIIVTMVDSYRDAPPSTKSGKEFAARINQLASDLECKESAGREVRDNG